MTTSYTIPAHYLLVAEALSRPIERIRDALCSRRLAGNELCADFSWIMEAVDQLLTTQHLSRICAALNRVGVEAMAEGREIGRELIDTMVAELDAALADYLAESHAVLHRPWPKGMETGQLLLAELLERPMRDMLGLLEEVREAILDPERAVVTHGGTTINLQLHLNVDREVQALSEWLDAAHPVSPLPFLPRDRQRRGGPILPFLGGLLTGYWIGKE